MTGVTPRGGGIRVALEDDEPLAAPIVVVAGGWRARGLVYRPGGLRVRPYADRYLMADVASDRDRTSRSSTSTAPACWSPSRFPADGGGSSHGMRTPADASAKRPSGAAALGARVRAARMRRRAGDASRRRSRCGGRSRPALRRGGLFAIGDTAHEVSPIGGQGMNLGLLDAATLAPLLAAWVRTGERPTPSWRGGSGGGSHPRAPPPRLATLNTSLGRPLGAAAHAVRRAGLRVALLPPGARLLAHAYAMGFDRDA